ncbi:MAG: hypothetical protein WCE94_10865 [Candidatus Methanoperedens sp.]
MEDSKKNAYYAGVVYSFMAAFSIMIAINIGLNISGQFMVIVGVLFGGLGIGSFWKPDSIGQIATQMLKNMQKNSERQNKPRTTKKPTTQIIDSDVKIITNSPNSNIDSKNKINNSKKSSKRTKK